MFRAGRPPSSPASVEGCCHDVVGPVLALSGAVLIRVTIDKVVVEAVFFLGGGREGYPMNRHPRTSRASHRSVGRVVGRIAGRLGGLQAARSLLLGGLVAGDLAVDSSGDDNPSPSIVVALAQIFMPCALSSWLGRPRAPQTWPGLRPRPPGPGP